MDDTATSVSTPLRFGILGAARIAPKALVTPLKAVGSATVTRVAARDRDRAEAFAQEHGIESISDSYQGLIEADDVDVVYNPLPMNLHAEWTIKALEAGKHVLCEKPFASNASEAAEMVSVAERTGRVLGEAFHYRYHPYFERIMAIANSGVLGRLERVEAEFSVSIAKPDIRWSYESSGGALMDLGCYPVSWLRHVMGQEPTVVSASATEDPAQIDASLEAELSFPSGATGRVITSMVKPFSCWLRVEGTEGSLWAENPLAPQNENRMVLTTAHGVTESVMSGGVTYEHMVRCFVEHVIHGTGFVTSGADSVNNMRAIDAIYEAAGLPLRGMGKA